jgi:hypothetical protein
MSRKQAWGNKILTYTLNDGAFEGKGPMNLCRKWLFQAGNGSPSGVEARM